MANERFMPTVVENVFVCKLLLHIMILLRLRMFMMSAIFYFNNTAYNFYYAGFFLRH